MGEASHLSEVAKVRGDRMTTRVVGLERCVKRSARRNEHRDAARSVTIALVALLAGPALGLVAGAAASDALRPSPSLDRQVDRLTRETVPDPRARRDARDQVRRLEPSAERTRLERALDRAPASALASAGATLPGGSLRGDALPSSLPSRGFR